MRSIVKNLRLKKNGLLRREQNRFAISFKLLAMTKSFRISFVPFVPFVVKIQSRNHPVAHFVRATPPREGNLPQRLRASARDAEIRFAHPSLHSDFVPHPLLFIVQRSEFQPPRRSLRSRPLPREGNSILVALRATRKKTPRRASRCFYSGTSQFHFSL
jgi:hypothetical protein